MHGETSLALKLQQKAVGTLSKTCGLLFQQDFGI